MADGGNISSDSGIRREIMLFGVRVVLDPMRKSVSLNNLSEYEHTEEIPKTTVDDDKDVQDHIKTSSGYASANDAIPVSCSSVNRERKRRGVPWTEDEHKLFLLGLQKVGKGDWKRISKNFVVTRTSTQVASHAQKYFLRKANFNRRRRRSSLFDMTTDTVIPMEEGHALMQENTSSQLAETNNFPMCPVAQVFVPTSVDNALTLGNHLYGQINMVPLSFHTNPTHLSLNLSLA